MSAVHSVLMDFSIDPAAISNADGRTLILDRMLEIVQRGRQNQSVSSKSGNFVSPNVFVGATAEDVLYTIRFQPSHGLITLNIEYMHVEEEQGKKAEAFFTYEVRLLKIHFHFHLTRIGRTCRLSFIICTCVYVYRCNFSSPHS